MTLGDRKALLLALGLSLTGAVSARARAQTIEESAPPPLRPPTWEISAGVRTMYIKSAGFDPFSTNDGFVQFSLSGLGVIAHRRSPLLRRRTGPGRRQLQRHRAKRALEPDADPTRRRWPKDGTNPGRGSISLRASRRGWCTDRRRSTTRRPPSSSGLTRRLRRVLTRRRRRCRVLPGRGRRRPGRSLAARRRRIRLGRWPRSHPGADARRRPEQVRNPGPRHPRPPRRLLPHLHGPELLTRPPPKGSAHAPPKGPAHAPPKDPAHAIPCRQPLPRAAPPRTRVRRPP